MSSTHTLASVVCRQQQPRNGDDRNRDFQSGPRASVTCADGGPMAAQRRASGVDSPPRAGAPTAALCSGQQQLSSAQLRKPKADCLGCARPTWVPRHVCTTPARAPSAGLTCVGVYMARRCLLRGAEADMPSQFCQEGGRSWLDSTTVHLSRQIYYIS